MQRLTHCARLGPHVEKGGGNGPPMKHPPLPMDTVSGGHGQWGGYQDRWLCCYVRVFVAYMSITYVLCRASCCLAVIKSML